MLTAKTFPLILLLLLLLLLKQPMPTMTSFHLLIELHLKPQNSCSRMNKCRLAKPTDCSIYGPRHS